MSSVAEKYEWMPQIRYFGPARVLEIDEKGRRVRLRLTGYPEDGELWARIAISGHHALKRGDLALVLGDDLTDLYLIGILSGESPSVAPEKKIALSGGARAETAGPPGAETLKVLSAKRELLFEYDEKNNRARVNMEAGDLEFVTRSGNITFVSSRNILFHGKSIGLTSTRGICMGIVDALGKLRSALTLQDRHVKLNGPQVEIEAERGEFQVKETRYTGKRLFSKIEQADLKVKRLESAVATVISRAKNVYQTVEQLSQVKAGRMRTLVDKTFHFKSKKAFVKSEEDYKIRAEKIHLG